MIILTIFFLIYHLFYLFNNNKSNYAFKFHSLMPFYEDTKHNALKSFIHLIILILEFVYILNSITYGFIPIVYSLYIIFAILNDEVCYCKYRYNKMIFTMYKVIDTMYYLYMLLILI